MRSSSFFRDQRTSQELEMMSTDELMILCHKKGLPIDPRQKVAPMEVFGNKQHWTTNKLVEDIEKH